MTKENNQVLEFISRSSLLEEGKTPSIFKSIILVIFLILVAFVLWSAKSSVKELAQASGSIIPSGQLQVVQHRIGGTIKAINVKDGQFVSKGQSLLVLTGQDTKDDRARLNYKLVDLQLNAERLAAYSQGRAANFSNINGASQSMIISQQNMLYAMQTSKQNEGQILDDQVRQKQDYIKVISAKIRSVNNNLAIKKEIFDNNRLLFSKKLITKSRYLNSKSEYNLLSGELESLKAERQLALINIEEYKSRVLSQGNNSKKTALDELGKYQSQIIETTKLLQKAENQVSRLEILSPATGIVSGLQFNTIGAVVKGGEKILDIVPTERKLVAEIKVKPNDIGHMKIGQEARLKVTSYDFTRYGDIGGKVSSFSATTFTDEKGNSYYKALLELEKGYVGNNKDRNIILPGMVVNAQVITGRKTVLQYLLKPVQLAMNAALSEK